LQIFEDGERGVDRENSTQDIVDSPEKIVEERRQEDYLRSVMEEEETSLSHTSNKRRRLTNENGHKLRYAELPQGRTN